jgi:hypothetical protein
MCLKGFGVQQEDPYTVHLLKTPDAPMHVLFLVLCYIKGLGSSANGPWNMQGEGDPGMLWLWSARQLISKGHDIREAT